MLSDMRKLFNIKNSADIGCGVYSAVAVLARNGAEIRL